MKHIYLIVALSLSYSFLKAQDQPVNKDPLVKFTGYVAYRTFFDTYDSYDSRNGDIYQYPKQQDLDANGDDVNKFIQYEALSLDTRVAAKISGPDAFGAKVSGLIEADYCGTSQSYIHMIRLRHAFVKLTWTKFNMLFGQYWHPMFSPECNPNVVSFGAGYPFNPLNRTPQAAFSFTPIEVLDLQLCISSYGYHTFVTSDAEAQRNSGLPDIHGKFVFKSKIVTAGVVAGIKSLRPRLETTSGVITEEKLTTFDTKIFANINPSDIFNIKVAGIYGGCMTPYGMIGGYGTADDPATVDDYGYSAMKTMSAWTDFSVNIKRVDVGLFYAYQANLGSSNDYYTLSGASRQDNLKNIMRISPRATLTSGKVSFSLEYILTTAVYGNAWDSNHKVTSQDDMVMNNRYLFAVKYAF